MNPSDTLQEALIDIRNRVLCPVGPAPTIEQLGDIATAALAAPVSVADVTDKLTMIRLAFDNLSRAIHSERELPPYYDEFVTLGEAIPLLDLANVIEGEVERVARAMAAVDGFERGKTAWINYAPYARAAMAALRSQVVGS